MKIITLSGKRINSIEDIYDQITRDLHLDRSIFGRNLDALYDVLSEKEVTKITITDNRLLKEHLKRNHRTGFSEYSVFLDVITDLEGVDITISD